MDRAGLSKRRLWAAVLAGVFALSLAVVAGRSAFSDDEKDAILMAVGYELLPVNRETMPFWEGGKLYVPILMFERQNITCRPSGDVLTMASLRSKWLEFNLVTGTVTGHDSLQAQEAAIYKNQVYFVPALFTANALGFRYSMYPTASPVPFVRITTQSDAVSDAVFLRAYEGWYARQVLEGFIPGTPTTVQGQTETTAPPKAYGIYLAVQGLSDLEEVLSALSARKILATFCLTLEAVEGDGGAVARLLAEGHGVILCAEGAKEAAAASTAFRQAFKTPVFDVLLTENPLSAETAAAVEAAGLKRWDGGFSIPADTERIDASLLKNYLDKNPEKALLVLPPGEERPGALKNALTVLYRDAPQFYIIAPAVPPVNTDKKDLAGE